MAKISYLIELPPLALISGFQNDINGEIHYAGPLLGMWKKFDEQDRQSKRDPNRGQISSIYCFFGNQMSLLSMINCLRLGYLAQEQQPPPPTRTEREQSGAAGDFVRCLRSVFSNFLKLKMGIYLHY